MRTEYIALHTAINLFEDFKDEVFMDALRNLSNFMKETDTKVFCDKKPKPPKELANFLFYITSDMGIKLYGKGFNAKISPIPVASYDNLGLWEEDKKRYVIKNNYNYKDRYCDNFNYAILYDSSEDQILYTELSVKYDEFLILMQKLKGYITEWEAANV